MHMTDASVPFIYETVNYRDKSFTVAVELYDHPNFNKVSFIVTEGEPDIEAIKESLRATKIGFKINLGFGYVENAIKHLIHDTFGNIDVIDTRDVSVLAKGVKENLKMKVMTFEKGDIF